MNLNIISHYLKIKINEYKVDNKYSVTIQNEKKAVDEIINNLTQDIVENILLKI